VLDVAAGRVLTAARRMEVKQTDRNKTFKEISAELKLGKESITSKCADLTKDIVAMVVVSYIPPPPHHHHHHHHHYTHTHTHTHHQH
jgi:hypothetical protein